MTARAPPSLVDAFTVCAGELGQFSASRLFLEQLLVEPDAALVADVVDVLGAAFPVFDVVAGAGFKRRGLPQLNVEPVVAALEGLSRLVIVGLETDCLDALLPLVPQVRIGLIADTAFELDLDRVLANFRGRVEPLDLADFQRWSGRSSGILTTLYGADEFRAATCSVWPRVHGADMRTRFRTILGWNVLGPRMESYPRWLAEIGTENFSTVVGAL